MILPSILSDALSGKEKEKGRASVLMQEEKAKQCVHTRAHTHTILIPFNNEAHKPLSR